MFSKLYGEYLGVHRICIISMCLLLLYDYNSLEYPVKVYLKDPMFTLLTPYNESYNWTDEQPDTLFNIDNFTFLVEPGGCDHTPGDILLITIISSKPSNFEKRRVIRNTWGKNLDSMKVIFLIGTSSSIEINTKINKEILEHGDMVQGNFVDAYRNMTYKHVMGLKWIVNYCQNAKYVMKTDDDVFVNLNSLSTFLVRELSPWGTQNLIFCDSLDGVTVQRDKSKWKVLKSEYQEELYPRYCAGWIIIYSMDVVPQLLNAAYNIPYFWIDDVYVTGLLATNVSIPRSSFKDLILRRSSMYKYLPFGNWLPDYYIFGPHDLKEEQISQLANNVNENRSVSLLF